MTNNSTGGEGDTAGNYKSAFMAARTAKRTTASGTEGYDNGKIAASTSNGSERTTGFTENDDTVRQRPASVSSYASILSPSLTGSSLTSSGRSQAVEDTLAIARANALKRLEARKKAKAGAIEDQIKPELAVGVGPVTPIKAFEATPKKSSPFENLFVPPIAVELTSTKPTTHLLVANNPTPSSSQSTYRSIVTPPSTPSASSSRYVPSGLSSVNTPLSSSSDFSGRALGPTVAGGKDKYGSISRNDKRPLGRHLPRIASGEGGWDDNEANGHKRERSGTSRMPSFLGRNPDSADASAADNKLPSAYKSALFRTTTTTPSSRPKPAEILAPSVTENRPTQQVTAPPTPGSKRKDAFLPQTPKTSLSAAPGVGFVSPRPEVVGEEMKGLMSAVGSMPVRGASKDDGESVTGMSRYHLLKCADLSGMGNRLRLSRSVLPPSASSSSVAPAPLPSRRLLGSDWMDRNRNALAEYEYLCHVGEALQWVEGCLDEETGFGVMEMEEGLRDGVVLAKLARTFQGEKVVKRIWTVNRTARS